MRGKPAKIVWLAAVTGTPPKKLARPAIFYNGGEDQLPYGKWSLVLEVEGDLGYRVRFLVDEAPHEWLVPGAKFTVFDGPIPIASGLILDEP